MNINFAKLLNISYLFDTNPGKFLSQNTAFTWDIVIVVLSALLLFLFNKDLFKYSLERRKRLVLVNFLQRNLILSVLLVLFFFLRSQNAGFLAMRFFPFLVMVLMLFNLVYGFINFFKKTVEKKITAISAEGKTTTSNNYQKYLPKKKKKK